MESLELLELIYSDALNFNENEEDIEEVKREYNIIKQDLELFEKCKNENCDYQIKNAELQEENEKLKQALDILKKYLHLFSNQSIPEVAYVEDYYLSLTGNDWCVNITDKEYELLKEVLNNDK